MRKIGLLKYLVQNLQSEKINWNYNSGGNMGLHLCVHVSVYDGINGETLR